MSKDNLMKFLRRLKEATTRRLWLKITSVLLALLIWAYIIDNTPSLTRTRHVGQLSVYVAGSSSLSNYGLALATDVYTEYEKQIEATVEISQKQFSEASSSNIVVLADVSNIRTAGTHEVMLTATSTYGTVTRLEPASIIVNVEPLDSRDVPIDILLVGTKKDGFWYNPDKGSINPQSITLSGPASIVQKASVAQAQMDITGQESSFRRAALVSILDSTGSPLNQRLLSRTSSTCSALIEIYPAKALELKADASQFAVADGYEIVSVSFSPSAVTVAADSELLDSLDSLPVEVPRGMPTLSKNTMQRVSIPQLTGFAYVSTQQAYMTIIVSEINSEKTIPDVKAQYENLADGYACTLEDMPFSIHVSGPASAVEKASAETIYAYVDLAGLTEGTYNLPVQFRNNSELSCDKETEGTIRVVITQSNQ